MEGANLSGLPEEPSELVTLLSNMAREVYDRKVVGKEPRLRLPSKEEHQHEVDEAVANADVLLCLEACGVGLLRRLSSSRGCSSDKVNHYDRYVTAKSVAVTGVIMASAIAVPSTASDTLRTVTGSSIIPVS